MIISCKECGQSISDKALFCPHCGYSKTQRISSKRHRLPNGFGQISRIDNKNLRNPYRAMVTTGFTETGKPICKLLKPKSYFKTYNEAYEALMEYHKNPFDITNNITFKELYEKWYSEWSETVGEQRRHCIEISFKYSKPLHNKHVTTLRINDLKLAIDNAECEFNGKLHKATNATKREIRTLFVMMWNYAIQNGLLQSNIAEKIKLKPINTNSSIHNTYSDKDINIMWKNTDNKFVRMALVQCYTGMRPNELLSILKENINLKEHYMIGGMKTVNGINRTIPIHPLIENIIKTEMNNSDVYLFENEGKKYTYRIYELGLKRFQKNNNLEVHRMHDARVFFVTNAKKYNLDEYAIKRIVGHSISDLTEKVYTKRDSSWLYDEICKISV